MLYRPIWTEGCDKRFCFDVRALVNRIRYVQRQNERMGLPPAPWPFITPHLTPSQRPVALWWRTTTAAFDYIDA
jgi:hypothetical protein